MTSFHMACACSAAGGRNGEREKDIDPLPTKATTTEGGQGGGLLDLREGLVHGLDRRDDRWCGAGKFQHAWNALRAFRSRRTTFVSLLGVLLFAFVIAACASGAPGTIGALLGQRSDGRLFVRGVPPGEGADRAGLEIDDEIVAIDGRPVKEMSQEEVRRAVRGDVGSKLTITVERNGQRRDVKVERSPMLAEKAERSGAPRP
jgi:C-terminal processing protease CtpA/Prc